LRDRLDLSVELILDLEQILLIRFSDEVDGQTQMAESSRSTDSMQVSLSVPREIEVDDHIHRKNIDTTSKNICANQASGLSILEVMINSKYHKKV
tara:strand:+ start:181 stop:465 length:285 start_codon:yes stop_codon:yes gene_type:complete